MKPTDKPIMDENATFTRYLPYFLLMINRGILKAYKLLAMKTINNRAFITPE
jgi:hypothetical protein